MSSKFTIQGNLCGDKVRLARAMHKPPLTQEGLANKLQLLGYGNMTKIIISRIEKKERHVIDAELKILSNALGVSMEWLVEDDDNLLDFHNKD